MHGSSNPPPASIFVNNIAGIPMKVFVNYDPVLECVVCVHTTEEGSCEKCRAVAAENKKHSYWLDGNWFDVIEDKT